MVSATLENDLTIITTDTETENETRTYIPATEGIITTFYFLKLVRN